MRAAGPPPAGSSRASLSAARASCLAPWHRPWQYPAGVMTGVSADLRLLRLAVFARLQRVLRVGLGGVTSLTGLLGRLRLPRLLGRRRRRLGDRSWRRGLRLLERRRRRLARWDCRRPTSASSISLQRDEIEDRHVVRLALRRQERRADQQNQPAATGETLPRRRSISFAAGSSAFAGRLGAQRITRDAVALAGVGHGGEILPAGSSRRREYRPPDSGCARKSLTSSPSSCGQRHGHLVQPVRALRADFDRADVAFARSSGPACRPSGSFRLMLCSSSGVVMTKMISSTNARSSSGVMLISLSVTSELRCEKRRSRISGPTLPQGIPSPSSTPVPARSCPAPPSARAGCAPASCRRTWRGWPPADRPPW